MVFSGIPFLFYFLPAALALYYLVPWKLKNLVLLVVSLIFYAWGEPVYILLMLFSILVDYTAGRVIHRYRGSGISKLALFCSIAANLGLLGFFKYSGFIAQNLAAVGIPVSFTSLPLPIGISFYTFQTLSYSIDVYRGTAPMQKNIITFGAFVTMFPQLIAGPIVRYSDIAAQLENRRITLDGMGEGAMRFIRGLAKKVLLANPIGLCWEAARGGADSVLGAWLGIGAFALQIYFDFSGYSDMAIGLGKMMGFDFPENFRAPYRSASISEFWRRWHITLGSWFRDYVYFPMGGSRCGRGRMVWNLTVVWLLTGLWHGAEWNFVAWGAYFGVFIVMEKLFLSRWLEKIPGKGGGLVRHGYALLVVLLGWVLFACNSLPSAFSYWQSLFSGPLWSGNALYTLSNYGLLFLLLIAVQLPWERWCGGLAEKWMKNRGGQAALCLGYVLLFGLCVAYLVDASFNPFLYFRF